MNRPAILGLVFVFTSSPLLFSTEVFDSPGRGYREQRDRVIPKDAPAPIHLERALERMKRDWPKVPTFTFSRTSPTAAMMFEPVAQYSAADEGAFEKIKHALRGAGMVSTVTESAGGVVHVRAEDVAEAKALLRDVNRAGHWSVKTLSKQNGKISVDE